MEETKTTSGKKCSGGRIFLILLIIALIICVVALAVAFALKKPGSKSGEDQEPTEKPRSGDDAPRSSTGQYRFAAVAADAEVCSQIGTYILASQGGSAVDSAIASLLCLGVVHPQSSGIGGGFLMTIYDSANDTVATLNGREVAPLNASENMYVDTGASSTKGGMAVAVPGEIAGMAQAHARYGKLPWGSLFEPAIRLCEQGVKVTQSLKDAIDAQIGAIRNSTTLSKTFLKTDGSPLEFGDTMTRPNLANTLRTIAQEGAAAYYTGSLANSVVDDIQDNGGIISLADLAAYTPVWKDPVSVTLDNGGYTLYGPPPPSSAIILQYILNVLDGFDMSDADVSTTQREILMEHRLVEALKFGFAKRSHLGDEDFVDIKEWKSRLQSESYATSTRVKINDSTVLSFSDYEPAFEILNDAGTTHLTVYGADGSVVAVTSTVNLYFGSKVQGARTGILFNNQMDDFSTPNTSNSFGVPASPSNFIAPGKRPMSSMSPTVVRRPDGGVQMALGASGGTRIITGILEVLVYNLWLGYNVTEAVDRFRIHHQLLPDHIRYETTMPQEHIDALKKKGHKFQENTGIFCVVQAIVNACMNTTTEPRDYMDYCIQATSDMRKGGAPDGY